MTTDEEKRARFEAWGAKEYGPAWALAAQLIDEFINRAEEALSQEQDDDNQGNGGCTRRLAGESDAGHAGPAGQRNDGQHDDGAAEHGAGLLHSLAHENRSGGNAARVAEEGAVDAAPQPAPADKPCEYPACLGKICTVAGDGLPERCEIYAGVHREVINAQPVRALPLCIWEDCDQEAIYCAGHAKEYAAPQPAPAASTPSELSDAECDAIAAQVFEEAAKLPVEQLGGDGWSDRALIRAGHATTPKSCGCVWRPGVEDRERGDRPFYACPHHQELYDEIDSLRADTRRRHRRR